MEFGYPTDLTKFMSGRESRVEKKMHRTKRTRIFSSSQKTHLRDPLQMTEKK